MDLWFKLFHIIGVVAFLGNITTGLFWHVHAARTRDPKILAHTMDGIIKADRIFTMPGVLVIIFAGFGGAGVKGLPILGTSWILWTIVLFTISGILFMARVVPIQKQLRALAQAGEKAGNFDYGAYHTLAKQWELWGLLALLTPLAGLMLMVLKPTF
jgi:uncharacterized membrane protein